MIGGIRTCLGVSDDPTFQWISSNRLIPGRNNVTWVWVEPRPFDQGRRKNDAFTHSATLPTLVIVAVFFAFETNNILENLLKS